MQMLSPVWLINMFVCMFGQKQHVFFLSLKKINHSHGGFLLVSIIGLPALNSWMGYGGCSAWKSFKIRSSVYKPPVGMHFITWVMWPHPCKVLYFIWSSKITNMIPWEDTFQIWLSLDKLSQLANSTNKVLVMDEVLEGDCNQQVCDEVFI